MKWKWEQVGYIFYTRTKRGRNLPLSKLCQLYGTFETWIVSQSLYTGLTQRLCDSYLLTVRAKINILTYLYQESDKRTSFGVNDLSRLKIVPSTSGQVWWLTAINYSECVMLVAFRIVFTCVSYAEARNRYRLDVCLSVRHTLAPYQNGWIYCHAFFTTR